MTAVKERLRSTASGFAKPAGFALSLSRNGVMAADRAWASRPAARSSVRRTLIMILGATMIGLGVALFVHARLGLPPYDVFLSVLRNRLGLSLGQAAWSMSAIFFAIATLLGRRPRLGGIIYVLMVGTSVDAWLSLVNDPEPFALRIIFVAFGMLSMISGISLVIHSGLTGGSFELLMWAGADRGFDPIKIRSSLEIGLFVAGISLGGDLGIATIVYAIAFGPLLRLLKQAMEDHREGRKARLELADTSADETV